MGRAAHVGERRGLAFEAFVNPYSNLPEYRIGRLFFAFVFMLASKSEVRL